MEHRATTPRAVVLIGLLVLLGTGSMGEVRGQSLRPGAQDKLPPRLRVVATGSAAATQLAALVRPVERKGDAPRYAVFLHARNAEALQSADLDATSVGGDLFTARLTPAGLRRAARMKAVESVEPGRRYAPLNDLVRAATGAHPLQTGTLGPSYTGDGTLACVIDTGIDWTHPDFRGPDASSTRIRALWDQTLAPGGAERPPAPFAYGVEYTRGEIENALASGADGVRTRDSSGHGTHVAATVAGSGAARTDRPHRGLAPEAGIVAVKTDFSGPGIADGLRYCRSVADRADRPVVATLSLGALHGPHDGSAPLARAVDAFTGPGRSVVAAAGNSGDRTRHLTRSLPASGADSLRVQVPRSSTREGLPTDGAFRLDVWLPRAGRPTAVTAPGGARIPLSPDTAAAVPTPEGTVVYAHSEAPNGTRHFEVAVRDVSGSPPASGTWTVVLENGSSASGPLHAWLSSTTNSRLPNGDVRSTLTVPATARSALAVGAWTHRTRWQTADGTDVRRDSARAGRLAPFSSRGPTRGGPRKPDLVAPGAWTVSARSRTSSPSAETTISPHYALRRGTSTAAAAAAGAVALLLEADPSLTASRLGTLLRKTARPASSPSRDWTPRRGHGQLDVFGAMARLHGASVASRTRSFLALDDPSDPAGTHTLGGAGPPALSRRFTPETSGIVDGLLLRTPSGTANRLRDSLAVSIWTDENGVPGRPIAAPARVGPDALANHTTTHLSLSETGAVLSADTTYHLVLDAPDEAGALDIVGRPGRPGSGSLARIGGEWTPQSTTLGVDVTTAFAADLSSPRLSDPATAAILEAPRPPTLSWDAVPSADAYTVQVSSSSEFEPARTDTLRSDSTALRLSTLAPSTGYHWRVRAERLGHPGPWSDARSFLYYPSTIPVRATQPFAADETSSPRFRLVALPGQSDRPVDETLAARPDGAWTAYRDRGRGAESLVPFDDSSPFRLRPGTGFWLRSEQSWRVRDSVRTVPLTRDGTYAIDLHAGWNIISNPFDLDVSWSAVETANEGSLSPLWRFSGAFERASTFVSAQSGTAFYFLNDRDREVLHLPYPAFPGSASPAPSSSPSTPPTLTLTARQTDTGISRVQVGAHRNAEEGRDPYDQVAPPARFARPALRIAGSSEDGPPRQRHLAADYRSSASDGHTFPLTLRPDPDRPVTLQAEGLDAFDGQEIVLVDPATGESYDLRTTATVTLRPEAGPRSLRLLVGSADYVETKQSVALPGDLQFLPNYPNPFSDQTTLEYVLPDPAAVRLAVYDVLGRQVRVLVDQKQEAGRHTVQWDGHDESGRRMASGVYLARLVVDGTTQVRKMTFVR